MFQSKITAAFSKPKAKSGLKVQWKEMRVWGLDLRAGGVLSLVTSLSLGFLT